LASRNFFAISQGDLAKSSTQWQYPQPLLLLVIAMRNQKWMQSMPNSQGKILRKKGQEALLRQTCDISEFSIADERTSH
jgi:hypothetical protein